jgi:Ca2+-binding RTX toxin-like protein
MIGNPNKTLGDANLNYGFSAKFTLGTTGGTLKISSSTVNFSVSTELNNAAESDLGFSQTLNETTPGTTFTASAAIAQKLGRLTQDSSFIIDTSASDTLTVSLSAADTANNRSLDDLVAQINALIGTSLPVQASRLGNRIVFTTASNNANITKIAVAGATALGFAASQDGFDAVHVPTVTAPNDAIPVTRLSADALFTITIGGTPYTVVLTKDETNGFTNPDDLVALVNTKLPTLGVPTGFTAINDNGILRIKGTSDFSLSVDAVNAASAVLGIQSVLNNVTTYTSVMAAPATGRLTSDAVFHIGQMVSGIFVPSRTIHIANNNNVTDPSSALLLSQINTALTGAGITATFDGDGKLVLTSSTAFAVQADTCNGASVDMGLSTQSAADLQTEGPYSGSYTISAKPFAPGKLSQGTSIVITLNGTASSPITVAKADTNNNTTLLDLAGQLQKKIDDDTVLSGKVRVDVIGSKLVFRCLSTTGTLSVSNASGGNTEAYYELGLGDTSSSAGAARTQNIFDIKVFKNNGSWFGLDLRSYNTIQDLIDVLASNGIQAAIGDSNNLVLRDTSPGTPSIGGFRIEAVNGSDLGKKLGLLGSDGFRDNNGVVQESADGVIKGAVISGLSGVSITEMADRFYISGLTLSGSVGLKTVDPVMQGVTVASSGSGKTTLSQTKSAAYPTFDSKSIGQYVIIGLSSHKILSVDDSADPISVVIDGTIATEDSLANVAWDSVSYDASTNQTTLTQTAGASGQKFVQTDKYKLIAIIDTSVTPSVVNLFQIADVSVSSGTATVVLNGEIPYTIVSGSKVYNTSGVLNPFVISQAQASLGPIGAQVVAEANFSGTLGATLNREQNLTTLISKLQNPSSVGSIFNSDGQPSYSLTGDLFTSLYVNGLPQGMFAGGYAASDKIDFDAFNADGTRKITPSLSYNPNFTSGIKDINMDQVVQLIIDNLPKIVDKLLNSDQMNNTKLPLINKSLSELVSIKDKIITTVDRLRNAKVTNLQQLEDIIESSLGLNPGAITFAIPTLHDKVDFTLTYSNAVNKNLSFEAGSNLFSLGSLGNVGISGAANLNVTGSLDATLHFGFDLNSTPTFHIYDTDTRMDAHLTASATNLNFTVGMGPVNLSVKGGSFKMEDLHAAVTLANLNDFTLTGTIDGELPLFFPSDTNSVGTIWIDGWDGSGKRTETALLSDLLPGSGNGVYFSVDLADADKHTIGLPSDQTPSTTAQILIDLTDVKTKLVDLLGTLDFSKFSIFDKMNLAFDGLNLFLTGAQKLANDQLASQKIPMIGSAFSKGADFIEAIRTNVVDTLRQKIADVGKLAGSDGAKRVAQEIYNVLSDQTNGLKVLKKFTNAVAVPTGSTANGTVGDPADKCVQWYSKISDTPSETDFVQWNFTIGGTYVVSKAVAFDLGVPGISLNTDGNVSVSIDWTLDIGLGINGTNGFYLALDSSSGKEFALTIHATADSTMTGSLGFLEVRADTTGTGHHATLLGGLNVDIKGATTAVGVEGITLDTLSSISMTPTFGVKADIDLGLTLGVLSDTTKKSFPTVSSDFDFQFDTASANFKGDIASGITSAGFLNIQLNMGEYMSNVIVPFLASIQKYTKPLQPMIDFLTSPLPVLKDLGMRVTPLDLAAQYGDIDPGMIYAVADIVTMVNKFAATPGDSFLIDFNDFYLVSAIALDAGTNFLNQTLTSSSIADVTGSIKKQTDDLAKSVQSEIAGAGSNTQSGQFNQLASLKHGKWAFPIIQDPMQVFGLLMGKDADLITYDMPALIFNFNYSQFFPIVGPIGANIGINFGAKIKLAFGYDTKGISEFVADHFQDTSLLLDGFYIQHNKSDVELNLYGGLTAAVELNLGIASAGVGGGVGISVDFSLHDIVLDNKVRLGELESDFMFEWAHGSKLLASLAIFDVHGKIFAELFAYLKIGWGWFSYTQHFQITPKITIADFSIPFARDSKQIPPPVLAAEQSNGDLLINAGPNAAARLYGNTTDGDENFKITTKDIGAVEVAAFNISQTYHVKAGHKIIFKGGAGNDTLTVTNSSADDSGINAGLDIDGGAGNDAIDLSGFSLVNIGSTKNKVTVLGGAGNDTIKGSKGSEEDDLFGNAGDDVITANGSGTNIIFGDDGEVSDLTIIGFAKSLDDGRDTLTYGGSGNSFIFGGGGAVDTITGGAGDDYLIGDAGVMNFTDSSKSMAGVVINDPTGRGVDGANDGSGGNDTITGGGGKDVVYGGGGEDTITTGSGNDFIDAGAGNDIVSDSGGTNTIYGGTGDDSITGGSGIDYVYGGDGNDTIYGGDSNDQIHGGKGNDILYGQGGNDYIYGDDDADWIEGGAGNDVLDGGAGSDIVFGDIRPASVIVGIPKVGDITVNTNVFGFNIPKGYVLKTQSGTPTVSPDGGNDTLISRDGSDFLDGQGGADIYKVKLRGGDTVSFINIADSGATVSDGGTLSVTGTAESDQFLLRKGDSGLGLVALLKTQAKVERINYWAIGEKSSTYPSDIMGIDSLQIDGSLGDDSFSLDNVAVAATLWGNVGNDSFQIGQQFNSPRDANAQLAPEDYFTTEQTSLGTWLSSGNTKTLTVHGGDGDDSFLVLRNQAVLSLLGEDGNDDFTVKAFKLKTTLKLMSSNVTEIKTGSGNNSVAYAVNAPVNIIGGQGYDSVKLIGTEDADDYVITDKGVYGAGGFVSIDGIELLTIDGAEGNDRFHILSTGASFATKIYGGLGSDVFDIGGTGQPITVAADDFKGHSGLISNTINVGSTTDASYKNVKIDGISANIFDNDNMSETPPVIVQVDSATGRMDNVLEMTEGESRTFQIWLGRAPIGSNEYVVSVIAPMVSDEDRDRGIRGFSLSQDKVTFNSTNWNLPQSVTVTALLDDTTKTNGHGVLAGPSIGFISLEMIPKDTNSGSEKVASINSIKTILHDRDYPEVVVSVPNGQLNVAEGGTAQSFTVKLTRAPKGSATANVTLSTGTGSRLRMVDAANPAAPSSTLTLHFNSTNWSAGLVVNVTANDDSAVQGLSDEVISVSTVTDSTDVDEYLQMYSTGGKKGEDFTLDNNAEPFLSLVYKPDPVTSPLVNYTPEGSSAAQTVLAADGDKKAVRDNIGWYLDGNKLVFVDQFGNFKKVPGLVHVEYSYLNPGYDHLETKLTMPKIKVSVGDNDIPQVRLVESNGSTDLSESGINDSYTISLTKAPVGVVVVNVAAAPTPYAYRLDANGNRIVNPDDSFQYLTDTMVQVSSPGNAWADSIQLTFNSTNWQSGIVVSVKAKDNAIAEDREIQSFAAQRSSIENILGPLYIFGAGGNGSIFDKEVKMLPKETNNQALDGTATYSGATATVAFIAGRIPSYFFKAGVLDLATINVYVQSHPCTLSLADGKIEDFRKIINAVSIVGNSVTFTLNAAFSETPIPNVFISSMSDSFFVNEADQTDRVYINNQDSVSDNTSANLRSGNLDMIPTSGIVQGVADPIAADLAVNSNGMILTGLGMGNSNQILFGDIEQLEINLGSGNDDFHVGATVARNDGKNTLTVINTGSGVARGTRTFDDIVTVGNLKKTSSITGTPTNISIAQDTGPTVVLSLVPGTTISGTLAAVVFTDKSGGSFVYNQVSLVTSDSKTATLKIILGAGQQFTLTASAVVRWTLITVKSGDIFPTVIRGLAVDSILNYTKVTCTIAEAPDANALSGKLIEFYDHDAALLDRKVIVSAKKSGSNYVLTLNSMGIAAGSIASAKIFTRVDGPLSINTQGGNDKVGFDVGATSTVDMYVFGGTGDDTLNTGSGANVIFGDEGRAVFSDGSILGAVRGVDADYAEYKINLQSRVPVSAYSVNISSGGKDTVVAAAGNNVIIGGANDDTITAYGGGNTVIGDNGTATFDALGNPLTAQTTDPDNGGIDTITLAGGNNTVMGGAFGDIINAGTGQPGTNNIVGDNGKILWDSGTHLITLVQTLNADKGGNDIITTGTGDSNVIGGFGTDYINVDQTTKGNIGTPNGKDFVIGDSGTISWDSSGKLLNVSSMTDTYGDVDWIYTGSGDDIVIGGAGGDHIDAGSGTGTDVVIGDNGYANFTSPSAAVHYVNKISSADPTIGGADIITAGTGNDAIIGGIGGDTINAGVSASGNNTIIGDDGYATFDTSKNSSLITNAQTADVTTGGVDIITTGNGKNVVLGGADKDTITAGTGDDIIIGDNGNIDFTTTYGISQVTNATNEDWTSGGDVDTIHAGAGDNVVIGGLAGDVIDSTTGKDLVIGDNGYARFDNKSASIHFVSTASTTNPQFAGNDTINTGAGDDFILGGSGNDTIIAGPETISSGTDNDVVLGDNGYAQWDNSAVVGSHIINKYISTDTSATGGNLLITSGDDDITTGAGDDITIAGFGSDYVNVKRADKTNIGYDTGNDIVIGDNGIVEYSTVNGQAIFQKYSDNWDAIGGIDYIYTGNGDDKVIGGVGADHIDTAGATTDMGKDMVLGDNGLFQYETIGNSAYLKTFTSNSETVGDNDTILTGNGDDFVIGSLGKDDIDAVGVAGDTGKDVVIGDNGYVNFDNSVTVGTLRKIDVTERTLGDSDQILTGGGDDVVIGGFGDDFINSTRTAPTTQAGGSDAGSDIVIGGFGLIDYTYKSAVNFASHVISDDTADGGNDYIFTGDGADIVIGGIGSDYIDTCSGPAATTDVSRDIVVGDSGWVDSDLLGTVPVLIKASSQDPTNAKNGDDTIFTGGGNDVVIGGSGKDVVNYNVTTKAAVLGNDSGADIVIGDNGYVAFVILNNTKMRQDAQSTDNPFGDNDIIFTGGGEDIVIGGKGNDIIDATAGTDASRDTVLGDNGWVQFYNSPLVTNGGRFGLLNAQITDTTYGGDDDIFVGNGDDVVIGGIGNDYINVVRAGLSATIPAADLGPTDTGNDVFLGDSGEITFTPSTETVPLTGYVKTAASTPSTTIGGDDTIFDGAGIDSVIGGIGNDYINASRATGQVGKPIANAGDTASPDNVIGDNGSMTFSGTSAITAITLQAADTNGSTNNDVIYTFGGIDAIIGGTGADYINSGNDSSKDIVAGDNGTLTLTSARAVSTWAAQSSPAFVDVYVNGPATNGDVVEQSPSPNPTLNPPTQWNWVLQYQTASAQNVDYDAATYANPEAFAKGILASKLTYLSQTKYATGVDNFYKVK